MWYASDDVVMMSFHLKAYMEVDRSILSQIEYVSLKNNIYF